MAPRTSERGKVIPVRDMERERAAAAPGPVTTYFLSPEELEAYREKTKPKGAVKVVKPQLEGPKNGPTKQVFLEQIANGETISSIERAYGLKFNTLQYWVGKWGLKGITPEKAQELLESEKEVAAAKDQPAREEAPASEEPKGIIIKPGVSGVGKSEHPATNCGNPHCPICGTNSPLEQPFMLEKVAESHNSEVERLKSQIEKVKAANVEAVMMAGKAAEKHLAEIERLKEESAQKTTQLITADREIAQLKQERDDYRRAAEDLESKVLDGQQAFRLDLNHYQHFASRTANTDWERIAVQLIREPKLLPLLNFALGAAGEAGEIADEIKKTIFHGHVFNPDKLIKEIGDALWYLSQLANVIGVQFETIAERNIEKLKQRYPEGFTSADSVNRVDAVNSVNAAAANRSQARSRNT
jgi:NTP pyrophosphatase (non-canonical NTP hydrolase)